MPRLYFIVILPLALLALSLALLLTSMIGEGAFVAFLAFNLALSFGGYFVSHGMAERRWKHELVEVSPPEQLPEMGEASRAAVEELALALASTLAGDGGGGEPRVVQLSRTRERLRELLASVESDKIQEIISEIDTAIEAELRDEAVAVCWQKVSKAPRPRPGESEFIERAHQALKAASPGSAQTEIRAVVEAHTIVNMEISRRVAYYDYFRQNGILHPEYASPMRDSG